MNDKTTLYNPFPGLRSFRSDQDHLFFGREDQTLELMSRLERNRFITVVGSSGRGKSSLVRCGLLSRLQGGGMAGAGAHWEIAVMQPGGDPLRHLAEALLEAGLYDRAAESAVPQLLATLGRSQFGLVQAVRQAALPAGVNFLLVVDQFEEIFRFDEAGAAESEVANDFIAMLREACAQSGVPIYVVVTMRSDFIGDCSRFDGLAEAVNRGEYLIPRLSREQFKSAIEGPIRVAGGTLAPRLLQRLLNDVGEEQDQLPCLQHALMRTWRVWQGRDGAEALDLEDYAQVGKMSQALSLHADEVYAALATDRQRELCAAMFKALTVEGSEKRGIRRPRRLQALGRILAVEKAELIPVIDAFRQPEVSFLMPPADVELRDATVIDLSHESLMRVWGRLRAWVDEEAQSVGIFCRLSESAALWRQGRTGLCRDPELSIARAWLQTNRPNTAWAEQYGGNFDEAMAYLQASTEVAEAEVREREERARAEAARKTRRQHWLIAGLAITVVGLLIGAIFGVRAQRSSAAQASQTDFVLGSRWLDEGRHSEGIAYLVRSGRKDPSNPVVAPRLLSALTQRNFMLPAGAPLTLPSPALVAAYSADGRWIGVQSEDLVIRVIDAVEWKLERELHFDQPVRRYGVTAASKVGVLAVILDDNTIVVCDGTGQPRSRIKPSERVAGGRNPMFGLSPDGKWLAVAGKTTLSVWDTSTGEHRATLPDDNGLFRQFAFSPDGRTIATTPANQLVQLFTLPEGRPVDVNLQHGATRWAWPKFSGDGKSMVIHVNDTGAVVCDVATGARKGPAMPVSFNFWDLWLTNDGSALIAVVANTVTVYDVKTGKPKFAPLLHGGPIRQAVLSANERVIATSSVDGLVRLWDIKTGSLLGEPTMRQEQVTPVALAPDGRMVAVFTTAGSVVRLRPGNGAARPLEFPRDNNSVILVNVSAIVPAGLTWMSPTDLKVFDFASGRELNRTVFPKPVIAPRGSFRSTYGGTFGPTDKIVVQTEPVGQPPVWHAWNVGDGTLLHDVVLTGVAEDISTFRVSPGTNLVSAIGDRANNTNLGVWDMRSGRRVTTIDTVLPANPTLLISPNDKYVAYRTSDGVIHVADTAIGKELCALQLSGKAALTQFRFTPDSDRLISGDDWGGVHVWESKSGRLLKSSQVHRANISRIDFSADGRMFATMSADGSTVIWDTATATRIGTPLVQAGQAVRVDFSHDGSRVVVPSNSGTARIYDVRSSQPVTELLDHDGRPANVCAFTVDSRFVEVHGSTRVGQAVIRLWSVPPDGRGTRTPKWLLQLATICGGQTLGDDGQLVNATQEFAAFENITREIEGAPVGDAYAEWARWFLSDSPTRSIAPGFTITPAEAKKLRDEFATAPVVAPKP